MNNHASTSEQLPYLSPAEWRIFSLLSKKGPQTVRQLVAALGSNARSYTGVLTVAQRITAKGYLTPNVPVPQRGPTAAITYSASVPFDQALDRHALRFLSQYADDPGDLLLIRRLIEQLLSD